MQEHASSEGDDGRSQKKGEQGSKQFSSQCQELNQPRGLLLAKKTLFNFRSTTKDASIEKEKGLAEE
jgi:hypothetical protein